MIKIHCDMCNKVIDGYEKIEAKIPVEEFVFATKDGKRITSCNKCVGLRGLDLCDECATQIASYMKRCGVTR